MPNPLDAIGAPSAPVTLRSFNDVPAQRQAIYDSALEGVQQRFPLKSATHSLEVSDLGYDDYAPTRADEKKALLTGGRLQRAMHGTVTLKDAAGKTLDQKRTVVAHIPHLTADGVVIHNGTRWGIRNQQRLRSGVYVRKQKNGGTEAHVNAKPGTGRGFRINLDPTSGLFKLQVEQSTTRLYPLMKALGVSDETLKQHWGEELFHKNWREVSGHDVSDLRKTVTKLGRPADAAVADQDLPATLKAILDKSHIDPDVTETTLGARHEHPHAQALVDATKKILDVANGRHEGDNRDSQSYQSTHSAEDFIKERLARDPANGARKLLWDAQRTGTLDKLHSGLLTPSVHSLYRSGLAQAVEDINPMEIYDQRQSITRMGEGGIGSERAVARDARGVQPSYLGAIDPTRTPESSKIGLDLRVTDAALKGSDGQMYVPLRAHRGAHEGIKPVSARVMAKSVVAFPGEMATGEQRVRALVNEQIRYVDRAKVDYELPDASGMFSGAANMIPLHHGEKSGRLLMGSRMLGQALPLVNPEAPLVQSVDANGQSFYKTMGKAMGAVHADRLGTVSEVTPDGITVKHFDGTTKTHSLYNHYPLARKCVVGSTVIVIQRGGQMERLPIQDYMFQPGDLTLSVDKRSALVHWVPVTGFQRVQCDKKVYRVALDSGTVLEVTEDHSLVTLGDDELVKALPAELVSGRTYLPCPRTINTGHTALPTPLNQLTCLEAGQFVGLYLAEGCVANVNCLSIAATEGDITSFVVRVAAKMGLNSRIDSSTTEQGWKNGLIYVSASQPLRELLDRLCGRKAFTKHALFEMARFGSDFVIGLLGGYLSGDGSVSGRTCEGGSRSERLRDDLRLLAASVGVATCAREATVEGAPFYFVRIRNESVSAIKAGWILERKRLLADGLNCSRSFDHVPVPHCLAREYYETLGFKPKGVNFHHVDRGRVPVAECVGSATLAKWTADLRWDRVTDVEEIERPEFVYDLSVGDSTFLANTVFVHNTMLHNTAAVKAGDMVAPGQLLAKSNFTDDKGVAAPGTNLRVAYLSGHGGTYEDAIVISESAAKKLTSEHHYKHSLDLGPHIQSMDTAKYRAVYGDKYTPEQYKKLGDDGVVTPGTMVNPGDPLLVGMAHKEGRAIGALMKGSKTSYTDISQTWDHPQPGIVTDVTRTKSGLKVAVKTYEPMTIGSKATQLYGGKGVVSRIVPDAQMPHDKDGNPVEMLQSPFGIITRGNPAALAATLLGKVAHKRGSPFQMKSFDGKHMTKAALDEARNHGVGSTEDLTDPTTGRALKGVFTGHQYILKLHHTAESKIGARDTGGYSADESPSSGGDAGSKRVGLLDVHALLSSGATEFLKDAKLVRGQRNDDYWRALKLGHTPIAPTTSFAHEHFQAMLKAAGVKLGDAGGGKQRLGYLTDGDVDKMAQHEIGNSGTFDFKTMHPIKDGLFDLGKTGGADGTRFAKITLPEKIPNPLAEPAITRILDLTGKRFESILAGKETLNGMTGPAAIEDALKNLPLERTLQQARDAVRGSTGAKRDAAVKRLGYLDGLQKQGIAPEQLMISKLPVLPPKYRPITRARNMDVVHDANYLYHDLMEAATNVHAAKTAFGESGNEYLTMYKAAKAVVGLHDPINPKHVDQGVKGLLRYAIGVKDSPKYSRFQRKVLGNSVDTVGRSVVTIDPNLDMDSMGMPEDMAWTQFRPFVIRRLVRSGMPASEAVKAVRDRTPHAEKQLEAEMAERPVVYNRAPSLHRYNYIGAIAKLVKGSSSIAVPQTITKGAGMDFDGDAINVHVPVGEKALQEVKEKLFPSKNLIHPNSFDVHHEPSQEFLAGLYLASEHAKKAPRTFLTRADAEAAEKRGEIGPSDPIEIVHPS